MAVRIVKGLPDSEGSLRSTRGSWMVVRNV